LKCSSWWDACQATHASCAQITSTKKFPHVFHHVSKPGLHSNQHIHSRHGHLLNQPTDSWTSALTHVEVACRGIEAALLRFCAEFRIMGGSALRTRLLGPARNFYQRVSPRNEQVSRSLTSNLECEVGQSSDRSAGVLSLGREFDATAKSAATTSGAEFRGAGASWSRVLAGARVRVLGRGGGLKQRGFCSTIFQSVEAKCWSCKETSTATPFFICSSCKAIQPLDQDVDLFQLLSV
jgi:hypothetical protein